MTTIGVLFFLVLTVAVGIYAGKKVFGRSENYFIAGRNLALPLAAATLMAQSIDGNATLGNTGLSFEYGFWSGAVLPIGLAISLLLIGLFFAKPLRQLRLFTLPDFYRLRYSKAVETSASLLMVVSFSILLAGNLAAVGLLLHSFFGVSYPLMVLIATLAILVYTVYGGLISDAYTDIIQVILLLVGVGAGTIFLLLTHGFEVFSLNGVSSSTFGITQLLKPEQGAYINWATIFALGLGDIVAIDFMARVFATSSIKTAKRACYIASIGTLMIGIPFTFFSVAAQNLNIVSAGAEPILFSFLFQALPAFIVVLILAGVFGASISTGDGAMLGTSTVIARNIFGCSPQDKVLDKDKLLLVSRLVMLPVAILGSLLAMVLPSPGVLLTLAFDVVLAGCLIPLVFGLFWKKANKQAAIISLIGGSLSRLIFFVLTPTIYGLPNNILYIPNSIFSENFDGLGTIIAPIISMLLFITSTLLGTKKLP